MAHDLIVDGRKNVYNVSHETMNESADELIRLHTANVELQDLVQRMLKDGQFFLTAVEAKEPTESDFEQWEKDARSIITRLEIKQ